MKTTDLTPLAEDCGCASRYLQLCREGNPSTDQCRQLRQKIIRRQQLEQAEPYAWDLFSE